MIYLIEPWSVALSDTRVCLRCTTPSKRYPRDGSSDECRLEHGGQTPTYDSAVITVLWSTTIRRDAFISPTDQT